MLTMAMWEKKAAAADAARNAAVEHLLAPCYEAAFKKCDLPRMFPKPQPIASGFDAHFALEILTSDAANPTSAKLKKLIAACDKKHKAALSAIQKKYDAIDASLREDAYASGVWAPAMILTDELWSARAKRVRYVLSVGWNKKGRWSFGDRDAVVFKVNTVAQLKAFVSEPRQCNTLLILLRRRGELVQVAGDWKSMFEFAALVTDLGGKVRVGNTVFLGADDDARHPDAEKAILKAFTSELFEPYLFDGAAFYAARVAAIDARLEQLKQERQALKQEATLASIAFNDLAKALAVMAGVTAACGLAPVGVAFGLGVSAYEWLSNRFQALAVDPPRGDFTKRARFSPVSLPPPAGADPLVVACHALAEAAINQAVAVDLLTTSLERLDGADAAASHLGDDVRYVARQAMAAATLAAEQQAQALRSATAAKQVKASWPAAVAGAAPAAIPATWPALLRAQLEAARDTIASAGVTIPTAVIARLIKQTAPSFGPLVGTTQQPPAKAPAVPAAALTQKAIKAFEASLLDVFRTIESA